MSCTSNKIQLIDIICDYVTRKVSEGTFNRLFVVTGSDEVPTQVLRGYASARHDFRTTHEEADVILVHQCYKSLEKEGYKAVIIISDDTDVFVLACYHYPEENDDITVYMKPTKKGRSIANIGESVRKHCEIMPFILQAHAISGCDSVCRLQGIGKATVLKAMKKKDLIHLGNLDSNIDDVIAEATDFIGECYNIPAGKDMSEKR